MTITGFNLPTSTTYAVGYTNSTLTTANASCTGTTSLVGWTFATGTSGTLHNLTTPLVVAASGQANNPLVATLTNDATMSTTSPAACANTYFSLPSFTAIAASGGAGTATTSPATTAWTS